jgi:hypothetical protein
MTDTALMGERLEPEVDILEEELEGVGVEEELDDEEEYALITKPFDPSQIRVETKPLSLDSLLARIENDEIVLQPDFQRKEVWKDDARSRLIESILIRIPLPAFYMDATDDDRWLVVDGQQRLSTLRRFVIEESLRLKGLEFLDEFKGCSFSELPRQFQRRIRETNVTVYLIEKGTPSSVKINIFKRINTGGLPLSPQEIRHALNGPPVTLMLRDLSESIEFRDATRNKIPTDRMADREYITRFLAFVLTDPSNFIAPEMDGFLNEAMSRINKMDEAERMALSQRFRRAMSLSRQVFGKYAFRKYYSSDDRLKPINKALFEAWSVNLDSLSDQDAERLFDRKATLFEQFAILMHDRAFEQAVSQGTGDIGKVRLRFAKIRDLIGDTIS